MKKIFTLLLVAIFLVAALVLARNAVLKKTIPAVVKSVTGLDVKIDDIDVGVTRSDVCVTGLTLLNPDGFDDRVMVALAELYVDYDLGSLFGAAVHLKTVRVDVTQCNVIKNLQGDLNVMALKSLQDLKSNTGGGAKKQDKQILIDRLHIKIGTVVYKGYRKGRDPRQLEWNVGIDEQFEHISDPNKLVLMVMSRIIQKTGMQEIMALPQAMLESLSDTVGNILEAPLDVLFDEEGAIGEQAQELIQGTKEDVTKALRDLTDKLPF